MDDTVGSLLAAIARSLQDSLRILMFADKRGWASDEFDQVRALEEALDEAKRDFQALGPLVNGQFYYENDRTSESLRELRMLRAQFDHHAKNFKNWLRSGGAINPLWIRDTADLRRLLHRAQCRAARRIFNVEREDGGSSGRCLGAFLVYRRLRAQVDRRTSRSLPAWRADQKLHPHQPPHHHHPPQHPPQNRPPQPHARLRPAAVPPWHPAYRQLVPVSGASDGGATEMTGLPPRRSETAPSLTPPHRAGEALTKMPVQKAGYDPYTDPTASTNATTTAANTITNISSPPSSFSTTPPLTLEDLVPDCHSVGSFERFGDHDIAFICDFCDGHIVWEDVLCLPVSRSPLPPGPSGLSRGNPAYTDRLPTSNGLSNGAGLGYLDDASGTPDTDTPGTPGTTPAADDDAYPRWQATAPAARDDSEHTVVFAPLAVANHLPPPAGEWEARLWCPYCDEYLYFDQSEADQTRYAQDERGFPGLAAFQQHLEWYHTALPLPALPSQTSSCSVM